MQPGEDYDQSVPYGTFVVVLRECDLSPQAVQL